MQISTQTMTRWAVVGLIAAVALTAWGCRRRAATQDGRLSARYERSLLRQAARDTGCAAGQLSPSLLTNGEPAVYTVTGCATPVEYALQCRRGRRRRGCRWQAVSPLAQTAAANMQCAPQTIQIQPTQMPTTRYAIGCGRQAPYTLSCTGVACGWAIAGPIEGAGPPVAAGQTQVAVQTGQPPAAATAPGPAGANLQAHLMTQREAILSCLDNAAGLALTLRWTASGQVILQIPPELTNTAAEGCIQAAVGALRVPSQTTPGTITVTLQ